MAGWTVDDPELLATFRGEVEERLASLQAGLLALEGNRSPRQAITGLFRDAHTVKGSARMLGLHGVLELAHTCEDLLGALRDGRFPVRRDLVDLLLAACDGIARAVPGAANPVPDDALAPLTDVLRQALAGAEDLAPPVLGEDDQPRGADGGPPDAITPDPVSPDSSPQAGRRPEPAPADSVRVNVDKVYGLLDVVGEAELGARRVEQSTTALVGLVAEQQRCVAAAREALRRGTGQGDAQLALHRLAAAQDALGDAVRGLREVVETERTLVARVRDDAMGLAMVQVRRAFAALPRIARDVAASTGKAVTILLTGQDVELDKQVLDGVADALKHLVINAVDHGCEDPVARAAAGKPPQATITVSARSSGGTVVIEVGDDGQGIDESAVRRKAVAVGLLPADSTASGPALWQLLFTPSFSTRATVSETSGRGVGLDVVQAAVEQLGGSVAVRTTRGRGTTIALTLPVTLGVLRCLVARVGAEVYAVPVPGVVESLSLHDSDIHEVAGSAVVARHGQSLPLLDLGVALGVPGERSARAALVVRHGDRLLAWAVDRLDGELELVVKDLGPFLGRLPLVAGATVDGRGDVVCLLDLRELAEQVTGGSAGGLVPAPRVGPGGERLDRTAARPVKILLIEDSVGVRELERVILENAGYAVETAVDGVDGASRLGAEPADLVLTDVEMPGMDGFTLTRTIRRTRGWEHVPVVVMTSRGDDADRRAGLDAGASAYLLKQDFDQSSLLETVRRLLGQ